MIIRDGHIHTPFCRHGSKDDFEAYVDQAISLGRQEISFTEHFPLPAGVCSEAFSLECALLEEEMPSYLKAVQHLQQKYAGKLRINKGFEVDYIEGKEQEIKAKLEKWGNQIEDSILSVHFVLYKGKYYGIDYREDVERLLEETKSLSKVYDLYFQTLLKSVQVDLGAFKPKRIGHPSLVRIFNKRYPFEYEDDGLFSVLVAEIKARKLEVDFNVAGLRKCYCGESYPSGRLLQMMREAEIPLIPGSDAHEVAHMQLLDTLVGQSVK